MDMNTDDPVLSTTPMKGDSYKRQLDPSGNTKGNMDRATFLFIWYLWTQLHYLLIGRSTPAYNFIDDEYVTTQDASVRRFHVLKKEWGIPKFINLDTFKDPTKGYLLDDN
ncbi:TRAF family protein, putative [Medicago truncatula]|uniref:TRAF family protein, putative n=1 Tax=Medicago truncatula TaxID=3880 RepID=G7ID92_MEDTR|nr:TRAF family protein, putative [Medicago truncatula]